MPGKGQSKLKNLPAAVPPVRGKSATAPGQMKAAGESAKAFAPGQLKAKKAKK